MYLHGGFPSVELMRATARMTKSKQIPFTSIALGALRPMAGKGGREEVLLCFKQPVLYGPHVYLERSDNIVLCKASLRGCFFCCCLIRKCYRV